LIDWPYYIGRLSASHTEDRHHPCGDAEIENPVVRVKHPDWLGGDQERDEAGQQRKIGAYFGVKVEGREG